MSTTTETDVVTTSTTQNVTIAPPKRKEVRRRIDVDDRASTSKRQHLLSHDIKATMHPRRRPGNVLRYPGGKGRATSIIAQYLPQFDDVIYSPFMGGGAVELYIAETYGDRGVHVVANDVFPPLVTFWRSMRCARRRARVFEHASAMLPIDDAVTFKRRKEALFHDQGMDDDVRAATFYVVNRCSFNGGTCSAGFSKSNAKFAMGRLEELRRRDLSFLETNVDAVHNLDWRAFLNDVVPDPSSFLYLDPPYFIPTSNLYGRNGDAHTGFDHEGLRDVLLRRRRWVLSYNDCEYVRRLYQGCTFVPVSWRHDPTRGQSRDGEVLIMPAASSPSPVPSFLPTCPTPRPKEKKVYGEVFTPDAIVQKTLSIMPSALWHNKDVTFLDPAAGTGAFPFAIFHELDSGLRDVIPDREDRRRHILERMLYMSELNPENAKALERTLNPDGRFKLNVVVGDALSTSWPRRFDIVIGNPPFQKGHNSDHYVQFVERACTSWLTSERGVLAFVIPNRFLLPEHRANTILRSHCNVDVVVHTVEGMPVRTQIGIVRASKKNGVRNGALTACIFACGKIARVSLSLPTHTAVPNWDAKEISDKVFGSEHERLGFTSHAPPAGTKYAFVHRVWTRWSPAKPKGGPHVFHVDVDRPGTDGRYLVVDDEKQAAAMVWYLSRSKLMRFLTSAYATSAYVPPFMWRLIPVPRCLLAMDDDALLQEFGVDDYLATIVHESTR